MGTEIKKSNHFATEKNDKKSKNIVKDKDKIEPKTQRKKGNDKKTIIKKTNEKIKKNPVKKNKKGEEEEVKEENKNKQEVKKNEEGKIEENDEDEDNNNNDKQKPIILQKLITYSLYYENFNQNTIESFGYKELNAIKLLK